MEEAGVVINNTAINTIGAGVTKKIDKDKKILKKTK
jgi:hypothetical protein